MQFHVEYLVMLALNVIIGALLCNQNVIHTLKMTALF